MYTGVNETVRRVGVHPRNREGELISHQDPNAVVIISRLYHNTNKGLGRNSLIVQYEWQRTLKVRPSRLEGKFSRLVELQWYDFLGTYS